MGKIRGINNESGCKEKDGEEGEGKGRGGRRGIREARKERRAERPSRKGAGERAGRVPARAGRAAGRWVSALTQKSPAASVSPPEARLRFCFHRPEVSTDRATRARLASPLAGVLLPIFICEEYDFLPLRVLTHL